MSPRPRLILFSGLGTGPGLVAFQRTLPFDVVVPEWIEPHDDEPLERYARRMAATVDSRPDDYIGGVSLGGSIALEAAHVMRPRGVFMITAVRSGSEIAWYWRLAARMTPFTPAWLIRMLLTASPLAYPVMGVIRQDQRHVLRSVLQHAWVRHYCWGAVAIERWTLTAPPPCPVHQIHGGDDHVMPVTKSKADFVIPGAGHLAFITHAPAVNEYVRRVIECRVAVH